MSELVNPSAQTQRGDCSWNTGADLLNHLAMNVSHV